MLIIVESLKSSDKFKTEKEEKQKYGKEAICCVALNYHGNFLIDFYLCYRTNTREIFYSKDPVDKKSMRKTRKAQMRKKKAAQRQNRKNWKLPWQ